MAETPTDYTPWDRAGTRPKYSVPPNACDCACHVFGSGSRLSPSRRYDPPGYSSVSDLQYLHEQIGVSRAVLVQASIYGSDHAVLMETLRRNPTRYRGVAVMDNDLSDKEVHELHDAGVRSGRFNILARGGNAFNPQDFLRSASVAHEMGWSVSLHISAEDLVAHEDLLQSIRGEVVVDHCAYLSAEDFAVGPAGKVLLKLLEGGNWWLKLSRLRPKSTDRKYETVQLIRTALHRAPQRLLWGTDWPHPLYKPGVDTMLHDAVQLDLLYEAVEDLDKVHEILVRNPQKLFMFAPVD